MQPTADQAGQHLDARGYLHALVQPTYARSSSVSGGLSTDYALLSLQLRNTPPGALAAMPIGYGQVLVAWPPSALGYQVHRSTSGSFTPGDANRLGRQFSSATFSDSTANGLQVGTTYYYKVTAPMADGTLPASAAVGVTPDPNPSVWGAIPGINGEARYKCSSNAGASPSGGSAMTSADYSALNRLDGVLAYTSRASYPPDQTFKFDLLAAVKEQLGIVNLSAAELSARAVRLGVDATAYGLGGSTTNTASVPQRLLGQSTSPAQFIDSTGKLWVSLRSTSTDLPSNIYTDHVRVVLTLQPLANVTASITADDYISLSWSGAGLSHVYRSNHSGSGYMRITDEPAASAFTDLSVTREATYYYVVRPTCRQRPAGNLLPECRKHPISAGDLQPDQSAVACGQNRLRRGREQSGWVQPGRI